MDKQTACSEKCLRVTSHLEQTKSAVMKKPAAVIKEKAIMLYNGVRDGPSQSQKMMSCYTANTN